MIKGNGGKIIILFLAVLLAAGAFLLPSGLFGVQDRLRAQQSTIGVRERVSVDNLTENYEKSLHNRMSILAQRLGDANNTIYLSESEMTLTEDEKAEILQEVSYRGVWYSYSELLLKLGVEVVGKTEDTSWKRYVIYDAQGILLVCYYVEICPENESMEIQMLMDAEDYTVYFGQGVYHKLYSQAYPNSQAYPKGGDVESRLNEAFGVITELGFDVTYWDIFFPLLCYYEVDFLEDSGYREDLNYREDILTEGMEMAGFTDDQSLAVYLWEKYQPQEYGSDAGWYHRIPLTYGNGQLTWEINDGGKRLYKDDGMAEFFMGFPALAELIPEYADYEVYVDDKDEDEENGGAAEYNVSGGYDSPDEGF